MIQFRVRPREAQQAVAAGQTAVLGQAQTGFAECCGDQTEFDPAAQVAAIADGPAEGEEEFSQPAC